MLEVAGSDVKSFPLDHLGLIAAVCKDLKIAERIDALLPVYRIRDRLKATGATLPNQLDKEVRNPTLRWIFQIMEGLGIVRFETVSAKGNQVREMVTNMTPLRRKIIQLLGPTACEMHGLIPENAD